jgi:hypothetical protein
MEAATGGAWLRGVLGQWGGWTRRHLGLTLLLSVGAFVFGWLWNTYIMAVDLQGSVVEPGQQTIATAPGQTGNGLFWLILFSLLAGLITYGWQRGWRTLLADLGAIPRTFAAALSDSSGGAIALLLWGASVSLIISTLISSAVSLALGLVLLVLAATPLGVILNFALIRIWKGLCGIVAPQARHGSVVALAPFMTMVGEALGLLLDWLLNSWIIGLVLGLACALVSVLLSRNAWRPSTAATLLIVGMSAAIAVLRARGAWADDGGWQECVTSAGEPCSDAGIGGIFAWFGSEGSGPVMAHATVGGASAGVGAAVGAGLGGAAAGMVGVGAATALGTAQPTDTQAGASRTQTQPGDTQAQPGDTQAQPGGRHRTAAETPLIPHQPDGDTAADAAHGHAVHDAPARHRAADLGGSNTPHGVDDQSLDMAATTDPVQEHLTSHETVVPSQPGPSSIEDYLPESPERDEERGGDQPPAA